MGQTESAQSDDRAAPTADRALEQARQAYGPPAPQSAAQVARCTAEQEAAAISGEIVVCRRLQDDYGGFDKEAWENDYAARTSGPQPIVVNDPLINPMVGASVVVKGCFLQKCPPPVAYMIDFATLPEAPEGSDADLIAKGEKKAR